MAITLMIKRYKQLEGKTLYISVDDAVEVENIKKYKIIHTLDDDEVIGSEKIIRTDNYTINLDTNVIIDNKTLERRVADTIKLDENGK